MSEPIPVTDAADPRVADYTGLRDPARRMRVEAEQGFFVGEGELVVRRMVRHGAALRSVLVTPLRYAALGDVLARLDAPVYVASDAVLRAVAGFDLHRGAVAAAHRPLPALPAALLARPSVRTVLALERVNDHENLGSLFRSAASLAVDAVLLCPECCDPLYRRCVRVSMAHVLTVPWAVTGPWPQALAEVAAAGFTIAALTPGGEITLDDFAASRRNDARVVLLLGAEGPGLRAATMSVADARVRVPMAAGTDSLNVAVAAAIAAYALAPRTGVMRSPILEIS